MRTTTRDPIDDDAARQLRELEAQQLHQLLQRRLPFSGDVELPVAFRRVDQLDQVDRLMLPPIGGEL